MGEDGARHYTMVVRFLHIRVCVRSKQKHEVLGYYETLRPEAAKSHTEY